MISALCIAFLSLCDIISKGYTYPLEWWEITLISVELAIEICVFIYYKGNNKGYAIGYRDALNNNEQENVPEEIDEYTLPIVVEPVLMDESIQNRRKKTVDSLEEEWHSVSEHLHELENERATATRFGKQMQLDREIEMCKIQLGFIESRLVKLGEWQWI